jgi:CHAT domain-containing protein
MTGKNISTSDSMGEMDIVGLSAGFLSGGARGVLAPLWSINDSIAARFSIEFYTALFADITVGEALLHAKKTISTEDAT